MTSLANSNFRKITSLIGSRGFFWGIITIFLLQAAWIALSGRYPMAFDENFHLGVIRLYAHHISPFWNSQPAGADVLGPIPHDPSYLYQYLMSFPYRLISAITANQSAQVIFLRSINIALFASVLPLYRRLLLKTGASRAVVHGCLAVFIFIPIVPLLAAQINYDNLLLPLTALTLLLAVNFSEGLRKNKTINVRLLTELMIVGLLTCLVKYAFLPILLAVLVYLAVRLWQTYSHVRELRSGLAAGWKLATPPARWLLLAVLLLSIGLFTQRYGVNMLRYHKPIPDCSKVLSVRQCSAYGPWVRNHTLELHKNETPHTSSPLVFSADWFYGMWLRSFFAVDGPGTDFQTRGPLILPGIGAIVLASGAAVAMVLSARRILSRYNSYVIWLFVGVIAVYVSLLWLDGYQSFLQTGQSVAINGRYLLPIIPLLLLLLALGVNELLDKRRTAKLAFAAVAMLCMLGGGGALTYILRSNDGWYWHSQPVYEANHAVQQSLGPVTPGYYSPNEFMGRN